MIEPGLTGWLRFQLKSSRCHASFKNERELKKGEQERFKDYMTREENNLVLIG